ncbi:hypothetical protein EI94DRAFT_1731557 [Lactarius quietus]|nr:hypothetical protein EI94DRAFT_1731557 [Lactarius quietus]
MDHFIPEFPHPAFPAGTMNRSLSAQGAAFYLVPGRAQGSTHTLNVPSPRRTPSPMPSPLPYSSQQSLHPAFPMPPGQDFQVARQPSPNYSSREPVTPHLQSYSMVSGPAHSPATYQRNLDDSDDEIYDDAEGSATHNGELLAKSPPTRSIFSGFSLSRPSRRQTVDRPVQRAQLPSSPCRFPECQASVRSDVAARLGGFCCDSHMRSAIYNGLATQCPRDRCQRVCPAGSTFCSAQCANGRA